MSKKSKLADQYWTHPKSDPLYEGKKPKKDQKKGQSLRLAFVSFNQTPKCLANYQTLSRLAF